RQHLPTLLPKHPPPFAWTRPEKSSVLLARHAAPPWYEPRVYLLLTGQYDEVAQRLQLVVLQQSLHGTAFDEYIRSMLQVVNDHVRIDSQAVVQRRHQVLRRHRAAGGVSADLVRDTVHPAAFHAAAGQHDAEARRPMVAAAGFVEPWCPAELAHH